VVLGVSFAGKASTLHRVRDDHRRTAVVDGVERFVEPLQVVTAEVADGSAETLVVDRADQLP
jgi:hypothetical protein